MGMAAGVFPFVAIRRGAVPYEFLRKEKEMAKNKATFTIKVKDGDSKYALNKDGQYEYKTVDYVQDFDNLADALLSLLEYVTDDYNDTKVTLVFTPGKGKK